MAVIYIVLPLALLLGGLAVAAFIWTVRTGQLDDLDSPSLRAVSEESPARTSDRTPCGLGTSDSQ